MPTRSSQLYTATIFNTGITNTVNTNRRREQSCTSIRAGWPGAKQYRLRPFLTLLLTLLVAILDGTISRSTAETTSPPLTTVMAVRRLTIEQVKQGLPVKIEGVVTLAEPYGFFIDDGTDAIYVVRGPKPIAVKQRNRIRITGTTCEGAFAQADIKSEGAEVLGQGNLPAPKQVSFVELDSGAADAHLVRVQGVVRAQRHHPNRPGGTLTLLVERAPIEVGLEQTEGDPFDFGIGSKVQVVGIACGRFNEVKQLVSARLAAYTTDVRVIEAGASDPFSVPLKSAVSLFRYGQKSDPGELVKVKGVVVHQARGEGLFIRDETGSLRITTQERIPVNAGNVVELVGFAGRVGSVPVLEDALVRRVGEASNAVAPRAVNVPQIFAEHLDAAFVTVEATLCGTTVTKRDWSLLCQEGETFFKAKWKNETRGSSTNKNSGDAIAELPWKIGSRLRLTGVAILEGEVASGARSTPKEFSLLIRSPDEITLLVAPPWWDRSKLTILSGLLALVIGAVALWVWELRREVRHRSLELAEVLAREAQLEERQRIGRELHDTFAQGLTGLGYELMAMARALPDPPQTKQHLDRAFDLLRRTREESRRGILNIRAAEVEAKDLPTFLSDSLALLSQDAPVELEFKCSGMPRPMDPSAQSNLMRIAQEATANTLQHAKATKLQVELTFEADGVRLIVRDDGRGFKPPSDSQGLHGRFGLRGMSERSRQIGASFELESSPGNGTRVSLWVPDKPSEEKWRARGLAKLSEPTPAPLDPI